MFFFTQTTWWQQNQPAVTCLNSMCQSYLQGTRWRGCWKALGPRSLCSSLLVWSRSCCRYWSACCWRASLSWHWRTQAGHRVHSRSRPGCFPPPDRSGGCWPRWREASSPALPPGCWCSQSPLSPTLSRTRPFHPWTPPPRPGRCWQTLLWTELFSQSFLSPVSVLAPPLKSKNVLHVSHPIQKSQTRFFSSSHSGRQLSNNNIPIDVSKWAENTPSTKTRHPNG